MKVRGSTSIAAAVEERARTRPGAPAISDAQETVSYGELHALITAAGAALHEVSGHGDVVEIEMALEARCVAALLACELQTRAAVLLPPGLPVGEVEDARRHSGSRFVLEIQRGCLRSPFRVECISRPAVESLPHGIAQLTSGSLGPSQLAIRGWRGIRREIDAVLARLRLGPEDTVLCASSIAHSYGLVGGLLAPLSVGAHVTLSPPDISNVASCRPTVVFGLARTYELMLARSQIWTELGDVRFALSAGAPLPDGLFDTMYRRTGIPIRQDYGTTETGTIAIDDNDPAQPDCVGRPLEHMRVRIGEQSEIQVRSEAVALGYLLDGTVVSGVDAGGWYHTHDAGSLAAGILRVGRRIRPPMCIDRTPVDPEELEATIVRVPGVREAVVLPIQRGDTAHVRAVVATSLDARVLAERLTTALPPDRLPKEIEVVDALPKSPAGKVLQKYLV